MATDTASRASMDHLWNSHGDYGGNDRATRKRNALEEAARQTAGPRAIAFYGARTPSLVPADTHLNYDFVNDGNGGFKKMTDINDVVEYGEARVGRLTGVKPKDSNTTWITSVFHLPLSMCLEVPDYYPRVDDNGEIIRNEDGTKMNRSRWIVRPGMEDEANRYFEEVLKFWASILPGGIDAIHGGSINYDESRPHMHVVSDPFEQNQRSKDPEALKMAFSKAFSYHPSSPKVPKTYPGTDTPVPDEETGEPVMIGESAQMKMSRYHKEFKAHMLEQGFDIEAERDAKRHNRRSDLHDYQTAQDQLAVAAAQTEYWEDTIEPALEAQAIEDATMRFELGERPKLREEVKKTTEAAVREEWEPKITAKVKALVEREAKVKTAESDAARITEAATNEAERTLASARAQEIKILADARASAEEEAKQEAEIIKADARRAAEDDAQKIRKKAAADAKASRADETKALSAAKSEAAGITETAKTEADKIRSDAQEEVKSLKSDWEAEKQKQLNDMQAKTDELTEMQEQLPGLIQAEVAAVGPSLWKGVNADYRNAAKQVITRDGRPASEEIEAALEYSRSRMTPGQRRLSELQTVEQRTRAIRENLSAHAALAEAEAEALAMQQEGDKGE